MLMQQSWMHYPQSMMTEWTQAKYEGKQVDQWEEICKYISEHWQDEGMEQLADALYHTLLDAPVREDYPYVEPSDLEGIRSQRPPRKTQLPPVASQEILRDKMAGAWIGRIAGCLLGKPVEGYRTPRLHALLKGTDNYPMHKYIEGKEIPAVLREEWKIPLTRLWENHETKVCWADQIDGISPSDDDTNYTTFALKLVEFFGRDFTSDNVMQAWLMWIPMLSTCTAERVAYANAARGLVPPQTAVYKNAYREYIGAQIRGDFFGYINPGNPELAAEMAFRDAAISHVKNGIYGEMYIAAMIAAAAVTEDIETIIQAGLEQIPQRSRLSADITTVLDWYHQGMDEEQAMQALYAKYDENGFDWCYTNSNAMIVTMALLYGKKEFGKSICFAVQCGFDTDCNGATVGSIVGILHGENQIPEQWWKPFQKKLKTDISGYNLVTVSEMADITMRLMPETL